MPIAGPSTPVPLTPTGGTTGSAVGSMSSVIIIAGRNGPPIQICGFIPLTDCSITECRTFNGSCHINPVFGTMGVIGGNYVNDVNSFFLSDSFKRVAIFILQKLDPALNVWNDSATIGSTLPSMFPFSSAYGTFYSYGFFSGQPKYFGININWGNVLSLKGSGVYRLKIYSPNSILGRAKPYPYCLTSEAFRLSPFNCNVANHTVKFEANQTGMIGSHNSDKNVFDLCGINLYDSVRVNGIFREVSPTKIDEYLEYQTGIMDLVNAKLVLKYIWESQMLPEYIYKRLMTYGGLSGSAFVSDYNLSNSRYDIKLLPIIMKSMEIEPNKANRQTPVKIQCESGIQSIIKSTSCNLIK